MKNDELKLKEDTKLALPKQELSDDELKKVTGGVISVPTTDGVFNLTPDYIISEVNNGNLELIKRLVTIYVLTYWIPIKQVSELIKKDFSDAGKQIPAPLKEWFDLL